MKVPVSALVLATAQQRADFIQKADKNGDGKISQSERQAAAVMGDETSMFDAFDMRDPNRPGRAVSIAEANANATLAAAKRFGVFDRTQDGNIDGNEVRSMDYDLQALVKQVGAEITQK